MMLKIRDEQMKAFEQTALRNFKNEDAAFTSTQGREISLDRTLKIRDEQMKVFEQAALRNFEDRMIEHLKKFAPNHFKILEENDIRKVIQHGWERAQNHSFTSERSIRIYIELMFILGSGFDTDPQYPWVAEMLSDKTVLDESERIDRLNDKVWDCVNHVLLDYLDREGKFNQSRFIEELRKLRQERDEILSQSAIPGFSKKMDVWFHQIFPKKCEYIGETSFDLLIKQGIASARKHAMFTERGVAISIAMMFILGSGFDKDPLVPWASAILNDRSMADETTKVNRLYSEALGCLQRFWA